MVEVDVSTPTAEATAQMMRCALPRNLMGGTNAMRAAGTAYLPQEEAESSALYASRLTRSWLFPAFEKTVIDMTGKVFDKPVTLAKDVPDEIRQWAEDI